MDLFMAICQGLGLALAIGIGGALAALFASAMASMEAGFNPEGTDYSFITETWFLVVLFAAILVAMLARTREALRYVVIGLLSAAGALAFAASLAEEGETAWPGLIAGAVITAFAALLAADVLEGAIRRAQGVERGQPEANAANALLTAFALTGIVLAALALFLPPVALVVAAAIVVLALTRRRKAGEKYEGLRILR